MNTITVFILKYWVLIILVLVLILMGIIGYIADSNGFIPKREKRKKEHVKKAKEEISKPNVEDVNNVAIENEVFSLENNNTSKTDDTQNTYKKDLVFEDKDLNFEQFESEFDRIVPEKPVISDELKKYMDEFQISPVNLNTKSKSEDIFTDIELPEIKKDEEDKDIWSF